MPGKMGRISIFCLSLWIISVTCQHSSLQHIHIDDFLNSKTTLFPNQTLQHHHESNLEETLELFKFILEDEKVLNEAYENFQMKYGVKHNSLDFPHHGSRKDVFKENLVDIFHHNLFARMKLRSTFEMGVNKFADMYLEEFKRERLGLIIPDDYHSHELPLHLNISESEQRATPAHFDWRDHSVITPVKDQMKCGACVMFSMTSSIEGHHAIGKNKEMVDLSEQFMVDCAVRENGYRNNRGCAGNTFPDSLKFAKDYGITSEHLYPYVGEQRKCKIDGMHPVTRVREFHRLPDNTNDVKRSVAENGPVSIGIYVWKPFMLYNSGVYDGCGHSSNAVGGHAMSIVGFKEEGKYYTIKNQWGRDWGENGYVRYSFTDARCGLEKLAYTFTV